jgi:hypothetical protein
VPDDSNSNPVKAVFSAPLGKGFHAITILEDWTVIQRVRLPSGNYIVNAVANVAFQATQYAQGVQCRVAVNGNVFIGEPSGVQAGPYWPGSHRFALPINVGISLRNRSRVDIVCRKSHDFSSASSQPSTISAIRVDRLRIAEGMGFDERHP